MNRCFSTSLEAKKKIENWEKGDVSTLNFCFDPPPPPLISRLDEGEFHLNAK